MKKNFNKYKMIRLQADFTIRELAEFFNMSIESGATLIRAFESGSKEPTSTYKKLYDLLESSTKRNPQLPMLMKIDKGSITNNLKYKDILIHFRYPKFVMGIKEFHKKEEGFIIQSDKYTAEMITLIDPILHNEKQYDRIKKIMQTLLSYYEDGSTECDI